jgi:hypothetical protein
MTRMPIGLPSNALGVGRPVGVVLPEEGGIEVGGIEVGEAVGTLLPGGIDVVVGEGDSSWLILSRPPIVKVTPAPIAALRASLPTRLRA